MTHIHPSIHPTFYQSCSLSVILLYFKDRPAVTTIIDAAVSGGFRKHKTNWSIALFCRAAVENKTKSPKSKMSGRQSSDCFPFRHIVLPPQLCVCVCAREHVCETTLKVDMMCRSPPAGPTHPPPPTSLLSPCPSLTVREAVL